MATLRGWATGRNITLLFILFLLMNLVIIPALYPRFQTMDILSSYSPHEAYARIAAYGEAGRSLYLVIELTLDLVYPFLIAVLSSLAIVYSFGRGFPARPGLQRLGLLPFAVMVVDYLENASIVTMLAAWPRVLPEIAAIANMFTVAKWLLTPLDLVFLVGLAAWLVRSMRGPLTRTAAS